MIVEYIRYALTEHAPEELIVAYALAARHLDATPECLGYELSQCDDDAKSFILRIRWTSAEGHMKDFRGGPQFRPFLAAIRAFMPEIAEMRHYTPTAIATKGVD